MPEGAQRFEVIEPICVDQALIEKGPRLFVGGGDFVAVIAEISGKLWRGQGAVRSNHGLAGTASCLKGFVSVFCVALPACARAEQI